MTVTRARSKGLANASNRLTGPSPLSRGQACEDGVTIRGGFSLVELAIVLVILGLLVGGVLTGQSLIRAAELRSVVTDFQKYQAAVNTFRDKYFALPGDMANATQFWGAVNGTLATCITTASPDGKLTCNGNGDGRINGTTAFSPDGYERYHFWLHLANAGLVEGSYSGIPTTVGVFSYTPGVNVPKTKISNGGWVPVSYVFDMTSAGNAEWFPRAFNFPVGMEMSMGRLYSPEENWNIDTKMDDGKPATGSVFSFKSTGTWTPGCATTATMAAEYNVTNTNKVCSFNAGF